MTMLSNVAAFATPHRLVLWCWWPFEVQYSWWWCFVIWLRLLDWADSGSEFMLGFTGKVYGNGAFSNTVTWKFLGFVTVWGGMFVQFGTKSAKLFCTPFLFATMSRSFSPSEVSWYKVMCSVEVESGNWQHKTKQLNRQWTSASQQHLLWVSVECCEPTKWHFGMPQISSPLALLPGSL